MATATERHGKVSSIVAAENSIELDEMQSTVPKRYQGAEEDKEEMKALGRLQELRVRERRGNRYRHVNPLMRYPQRNFTFITILGFGSTLICTWEVVLAYVVAITSESLESCIDYSAVLFQACSRMAEQLGCSGATLSSWQDSCSSMRVLPKWLPCRFWASKSIRRSWLAGN